MYKKFIVGLFLLFLSSNFFSQEINNLEPQDIPKTHWAYSAVIKLLEQGILSLDGDKKFRGDMVITRYEVALMLVKLFTRVESLEKLFSETKLKEKKTETPSKDEDDKIETINKLIQEFRSEINAIKKINTDLEKKVTDAVKKIEKFEKDAKKEKIELKKDLATIKRDITTLKKDLESSKEEQQRISFSGENYLKFENRDFGASGMKEDTEFGMVDDAWSKTRGRAASSIFSAEETLKIKMKASPKLGIKTDKKIELNASFDLDYKHFAYGVDHKEYSLNINDLYFNYSAPRSKFLSFRAGSNSVGWTVLSLAMTGWKFYGFKASSIIGKNTADFVAANVVGREMRGVTTSSDASGISIEKEYSYAETLYGMSILHSYGKSNFARFSIIQNKQDKDSFAPPEGKRNLYQPGNILVYSVFTRLGIAKSMSLTGEVAVSNFAQYEKAPYYFIDKNGNNVWNEGEEKILDKTVPIIHTRDTAYVALIDYSRKGISTFSGYARQNPEFQNRHGGIMALLGSFGGASFGGFDIGGLLKGLEAFFSMTTWNPAFAQGLTVKSIIAKATEVEPAPLSTLPEKFNIPLTLDPDIDKRKNKLGLNIFMPEISYRPGAKTTLTLSIAAVKGKIDREAIKGVTGIAGEMLSINYQSEGANLGNPNSPRDPYIKWADTRSPTGWRYVFLHFEPSGNNEYIEYEYPIGSGTWIKQPVNLTKGEPVNFTDSSKMLDIPGNAGQYVLKDSTQLGKVVDKILELGLTVSMPKLTLIHDFSKKIKYKFEYSILDISVDKGSFYDPTEKNIKSAIETAGIKTKTKTTINNTLTYDLFKSITLTFQYNLEYRKYYVGHKENEARFVFETKLVF